MSITRIYNAKVDWHGRKAELRFIEVVEKAKTLKPVKGRAGLGFGCLATFQKDAYATTPEGAIEKTLHEMAETRARLVARIERLDEDIALVKALDPSGAKEDV